MEKLFGVATELFELLVLLLGAGIASVAGLALERFGIAAMTGGDVVVGLWAVAMGFVALYVGVVALGYEQVLPRVRTLAADE